MVAGKPVALAPMDAAAHGIAVCVTVDYPAAMEPDRIDVEANANGCGNFDDAGSCG